MPYSMPYICADIARFLGSKLAEDLRAKLPPGLRSQPTDGSTKQREADAINLISPLPGSDHLENIHEKPLGKRYICIKLLISCIHFQLQLDLSSCELKLVHIYLHTVLK